MMARPLSEEKRDAILAAAAELVATQGIGAPTAKIARNAGVAEGTLFTYFATKDELLNALFLRLETELASAMLDSLPEGGDAKARVRHIWDGLIDWGAAHPLELMAIRQLKVSDRLSEQSRERGRSLFREMRVVLDACLAGRVDPQRTDFYLGSVLGGLVEITLEAIAASPKNHKLFKDAGFDLFWKGIAR